MEAPKKKKLSEEEQKILNDIAGFSMSLGICKAVYHENNRIISHIPVSFYPYLLSLSTYNKLMNIHRIWQKLFVKISEDRNFVTSLSEKFCQGDDFMKRFLEIYKTKNNQSVGIACTRVDYMGDQNPQLVEFNLMSVGLNAMSDRVQTLHTLLNKHNSPKGKYLYPVSKNQQTFCNSLIFALKQANLTNGLVLMIVHDKQFNYGDHHAFRIEMVKQGRPVQYVTMKELIDKMKYEQDTAIAYLDDHPIDAFYFRTGYALSQFPTQQHWIVRKKIEQSRAIKLPSVEMILINSKRMQSQIAKLQILKKFLNQKQAELITNISGQIYDFDNKSNDQIEKLIEKTQKCSYVLKPNREGGGNNFFGQGASKKLKELYQEKIHLKNYILMKKIESKVTQNYFVFDHVPVHIPKATAQFSTLGCFVYSNGKLMFNQVGGSLVRLKRQEVDQGGIAINQGAISGICVVNYQE